MDWLWPLLQDMPQHATMISAAIAGDQLAVQATTDLINEELKVSSLHPFEVGKKYYVETNTLYYVGECTGVSAFWLEMKNASWVYRTGKKATLFEHMSFDASHFEGVVQPITEFVGDWTIPIAAMTGFKEFLGELPK